MFTIKMFEWQQEKGDLVLQAGTLGAGTKTPVMTYQRSELVDFLLPCFCMRKATSVLSNVLPPDGRSVVSLFMRIDPWGRLIKG